MHLKNNSLVSMDPTADPLKSLPNDICFSFFLLTIFNFLKFNGYKLNNIIQ